MQLLFEKDTQITSEELKKIYAGIFTSNDGKIVLQDLANMSGMYRTNFTHNSSDHTAFFEGQRALFLYICSHLEDNTKNIEGKFSS